MLIIIALIITVLNMGVTTAQAQPLENSAYHALSGGAFTQDWSDPDLIVVDNRWIEVPGIEGFRGDDLAPMAVDPQTILVSDTPGVINVTANKTNPNTYKTGGVVEFEITNPVIGLMGSGVADAPYLKFYINSTGCSNIHVAYTVRDIDGSNANAEQPVALHFRAGGAGDFTNVPLAYIADATTGPNLATKVTPIDVTLPAAANNQPVLEVRVMTNFRGASNEWVGIDDINISGTCGSGTNEPILLACPLSISTTQGIAATGDFSATDADSTLNDPEITNTPSITGISLTDVLKSGSSLSGKLYVDADTPIGAYEVEIKFTNTDAVPQEAACTVPITVSAPTCTADDVTKIGAIQGSGASAAITDVVTVKGVVISDNEGAYPHLRGFYLQDSGDGDETTSDGIFVYNNSDNSVALGDVVQVIGTPAEYQGQTQLGSVTSIEICTDTAAITPVDLNLPFASVDYLERFEGMLVRFPQTLYVTEHYQLGRFGQVTLSGSSRLNQPTHMALPGPDALALQNQNDLNRIIVDDSTNDQNHDPILFGLNGNPLTSANTLRAGDTAANIVGVLTYTGGGHSASPNAYRVRPLNALTGSINFVSANPRPAEAPPLAAGNIRVTAINLLNFFNTLDDNDDLTPGCYPGMTEEDCRGADSDTEFVRQWTKTVEAIVAAQADVIGIMEIENDGYGSESAIQFLIDKLNAATSAATYAFIDADALTGETNVLGTDAIKVGMLYKPAKVTPVGTTAVLNSGQFVNGGDSEERNRPSLAQAFEEVGTGAQFVVAVNHLKSKSSACDDPDALDGQGNCNIVRINAANALARWLATDPTGTAQADALIVGDLNSYAMEDPIRALQTLGYTNLIHHFAGDTAYSYVFDGQWGYLDHALGTAKLTSQVSSVAEWHINSDEPAVLDYNTEFKSAAQLVSLYAPDEFRMSDHDPLLIDINLSLAPEAADQIIDINEDTAEEITLKAVSLNHAAAFTYTIVSAPLHGTLSAIVGDKVTYTPNADFNGTDTFTFKASDGTQDTNTAAIYLTITAVNDPPTFTKGENLTVDEDAGMQTVIGWATAINPGPDDEAGQPLTFNLTAHDPALFSAQPAIDDTGTLTYTPVADANGTTTVTVSLFDGTDSSPDQSFTITITPVNDPPAFTKGADQTVLEDSPTQTVTGWAASISPGPDDEAGQTLTFNLTAHDPTLFSAQPAVNAVGDLTFTPAADANGSTTVSVTLDDGFDTTEAQNFTITITEVNDPPAFTKGADQTVLEDAPAQTVLDWATAINPGPDDEAGQTLTFTVTADDPTLFSVQPAVNAVGDLTFTPALDANGSTTVTVTLDDGFDTTEAQTFTITITPVNDPPAFTKGADQTVLEDAPAQTMPGWATAISPGPDDEAGQTLTFTVTADDPALFSAQPSVNAVGDLTFTPAVDANGTTTVTVSLSDGTDSSPDQSFTITITEVNDLPSFTRGIDQTVLEDAPTQTVIGWVVNISPGPDDEAGQTLTFNVTADDPTLFSVQPAVNAAGDLTFTPAADANGTTTVTVSLFDGTDSSPDQSFTITITEVNDPPAFTKGADQTVAEDSGVQTILKWATNISPGPENESHQTLTFNVTADDPALFSVQPAVNAVGDLTFTPAADANGTTTVSVTLEDGFDTTEAQTFTITITAINDAPVAVADSYDVDESRLLAIGAQGVLTNDTDIDGDPLTAILVTPAANGTLTLHADGAFIYTPNPNFSGIDSFTYRANDGQANSNIVTVTINVPTIPITGGTTIFLPLIIR
jgi:predicted extracellular nuclease